MAKYKTTVFAERAFILIILVFKTEAEGVTAHWQPSSQLVKEGGETVILSCLLQGFETTNAVTVRRNGVEVTPRLVLNSTQTSAPNSKYLILTDSLQNTDGISTITYFLQILAISREDDGLYECQLLSNANSNHELIATDTIVLNVFFLPTGQPKCSPGETSFLAGNKVFANCTSEKGNPPITLKWMHAGKTYWGGKLTEKDGVVTSTIEISDVLSPSGYFICMLSFNGTIYPSEPPRTCQAGPITIITNPLVFVTPVEVTKFPGEDVTFTCTLAAGDSIATKMWSSENIPKSKIMTKDDARMVVITNVQPEDSGTITCRVSTGPTSFVEASAQLIVKTLTTEQMNTLEAVTLGSQNSGLSRVTIIGITIGFIIVLIFLIIVVVILIAKSRRKNKTSSNQEPQAISLQKEELSGPVVYADLDLTNTPSTTEVRPPTEEPTVYASVRPQKVENEYT